MHELRDTLIAEIMASGPMRLDAWMARCLSHYYGTRDPLGAAGDFTTAPEISQMFGELCGLWLAQVWFDAGSPSPFVLAEAGPGRGTLMADILRVGRAVPGFLEAAKLHLIETSPALRAVQAERLDAHNPVWLDRFDDLPPGPVYLIANEFFDALPIRQFHRSEKGWHERLVGVRDNALAFGLSPAPVDFEGPPHAAPGAVVEVCPAGREIAGAIGARLRRHGGAALIIDYGHLAPASGDTLQALRGHAFADPLAEPGHADLTAHVDFAALAAAAAVTAHGAAQGAWLTALGIDARAASLKTLNPAQAGAIDAARQRLTAPDQMGNLFKVMALMPDGSAPPPGFAQDAS